MIARLLARGRSVLLVGATDAGKSYFATKVLLPMLQAQSVRAAYVTGPNRLHFVRNADIVLIDEVELAADAPIQERLYPEDAPAQWSRNYRRRVQGWMRAMARVRVPCVYIVTRNTPAERQWIATHIRRAEWDGRTVSVVRFEAPVPVGTPDQRARALWAADCAEHVLRIFETRYLKDARPRAAIAAARAWARGEIRTGVARTAALAAHAAARDATNTAAVASARAAAHAAATAHMIGHATHAAMYAVKAAGRDATRERAWQEQHR